MTGNQSERTDLAWRRTGASTFGMALVGLKLGLDGEGAHVVAGAIATFAAAGFAVLAYRRSVELRAVDRPAVMRPGALAWVAGLLLVLELAGLALVLAPA